MGHFRIKRITGVTSLGVKRVSFSKVYAKANTNHVRSLTGGEDGISKANLNCSFAGVGYIEEGQNPIIVEKTKNGYLVCDGNLRFSQINPSILPADQTILVEIVKFESGSIGRRARKATQGATNLPLSCKPHTAQDIAIILKSMCEDGDLNVLDDDDLKNQIEEMAGDRSKSWKNDVKNRVKQMKGLPVEFIQYSKDKSAKFLGDIGIGTEGKFNSKDNVYETVTKSGSEYRTENQALMKFMSETELSKRLKTRAIRGLENSPAGGDFNAARRAIKDKHEEIFNTWKAFFMEYGTTATLDTFMVFTDTALPQDGINEKDADNNGELVDIT